MSGIKSLVRAALGQLREIRSEEYKAADAFLKGHNSVVDVGCGTGTFLARDPQRRVGVDINPENVEYCRERGLNAQVGSALELPFPDNSFDGAMCSHLLQVFTPSEAVTVLKELGRVVRPGGVIAISTLNWFRDFYQHPENERPYPPDALLRYFYTQRGATSPMWPGMPLMKQEAIWLRHPPLIKFRWSTRPALHGAATTANSLQYGLYMVKPWAYDSYVIKLRNHGIV